MYKGKTICVVVPAFNEQLLIDRTMRSVPDFVDSVVVVDDASTDSTVSKVVEFATANSKVKLVQHQKNMGVGAAIASGYGWAVDHQFDIAVVMAGDGQMDPHDLPALLDPVVEEKAGYSKGNRLVTGEAWKKIPKVRYLGNSALTLLTKIASGYWHVTDSQSGYSAISRKVLQLIPISEIYPRYGMPNDLLVTLNIYGVKVADVPVTPVYGIGEKSGIRISRVIFTLSFLMLRLFIKRMVHKYVIRDFHPLVFFYALGALMLCLNIPLGLRLLVLWGQNGSIPPINALTIVFCTFIGLQSVLFAMLFDMEANRDLKP